MACLEEFWRSIMEWKYVVVCYYILECFADIGVAALCFEGGMGLSI
jgi:hypothetical protein